MLRQTARDLPLTVPPALAPLARSYLRPKDVQDRRTVPPVLARVFDHLAAHGSVSEAELNNLLGSPRAARRFANHFNKLVRLVPFRAHAEGTAAGKPYVRDQEE